jgi:glycosyltransferase involved in cell wall biosynthesis
MANSSGIGTYIRNLVANLGDAGEDFDIALIGDRNYIDAPFGIIESDAPIFSVREQFQMPKLAKSADLLHVPHHNVPLFWSKKLVVTFHDALHWDHPELLPSWKAKIYLKAVSTKILRANAVITPSKFTAGRLVDKIGVDAKKVFVIPEGFDAKHFYPRPDETVVSALKNYNLQKDGYLLFVGNLKKHKNIERMVEAYSDSGVDVPLVLVGRAEGLNSVVELARLTEVKGVVPIGAVPYADLPILYCGARALVFVSLYEGFGLPPLEAMSCQCPVVASTAASIPEVVGDAALNVDPYDTEKIADAISKIVLDKNLRKRLIVKGMERTKLFSWRAMATETQKIYRTVIETDE